MMKLKISLPGQRLLQIRNDLLYMCPILLFLVIPLRRDISLICTLTFMIAYLIVLARRY